MNEVATIPHAVPMSFDTMRQLAESIAKSRLFGIQTADQALTLMSIAQAEGRHPALAARDYHIIQGSPAKKAEAMQRDFMSAGGRIEWHQLDDAAADATFSHPAGGSARIRWDQERVVKAGLSSNPMHKKYPRQMLRSRVVSEGVRTVWPMATSGMYVPEEVTEFAQPRGEPIDVTPKADLDRFVEAVDIINSDAETLETAHAAASHGTKEFRIYWRGLSADFREILRPGLAGYQRIAEAADRAAADADDDPFGLSPLDGSAMNAPAGTPQPQPQERATEGQDGSVPNHSDQPPAGAAKEESEQRLPPPAPTGQSARAGAPGSVGAGTSEDATASDLLGGEPAENLTVPLGRNPSAADFEYFARQLHAMISEKPRTAKRIAQIRMKNEAGFAKLKAALPDAYNELQRELAR